MEELSWEEPAEIDHGGDFFSWMPGRVSEIATHRSGRCGHELIKILVLKQEIPVV